MTVAPPEEPRHSRSRDYCFRRGVGITRMRVARYVSRKMKVLGVRVFENGRSYAITRLLTTVIDSPNLLY